MHARGACQPLRPRWLQAIHIVARTILCKFKMAAVMILGWLAQYYVYEPKLLKIVKDILNLALNFFFFFSVCPRNMILSETSGSITSHFYPRLYSDNQTCIWQITAKQGNWVKLEITAYNIQQCRPNCTCDYLQVQNGFSYDATGKICGVSGIKPITYYSLKESLTVLFVSDSTQSKSYDGFEATYKQLNHTPPSK